MIIWFDLSQLEDWFIDRRGISEGMFTRNCLLCLPASASPESNSSDSDDDNFLRQRNLPNWNVNTLSTKDANASHGSVSTSAASTGPLVVTARPPSNGSSSSNSTIIVGSSGPEAMQVLLGHASALSAPDGQFTVPSPTMEVTISTMSTNFHVSSASTMVINSTGHSSLPQLSYGDVKKQLPPTNTLDFSNISAAPTTTYTPLGVAQMMLGLPRNASMLSNVAPTNPMPTTVPVINKEKPITTKSYTLGVNAFGNLSTPEQQISWLHQSADIALQGGPNTRAHLSRMQLALQADLA